MTGCYRRAIMLDAPRTDLVVGAMEDDFHSFRVELGHDGATVTDIRGDGLRFPWSTCPQAASELRVLIGKPLTRRATDIAALAHARSNCTHLYDLAGLVLAHAGAGRTHRRYDATVPDRMGTRTRATLERDGEQLLSWSVKGNTIDDPPPYAGRHLKDGFLAWADATLDADAAEATTVLRRALHISWGREQDLDAYDRADDLGPVMNGSCFTFQPERMPVALRVKGSIRDFSDGRRGPLG